MAKEEGVRNNPEVVTRRDMKYDILGGQIKADHILLSKDRPIKGLDLDDAKLMKLEIIRSKLIDIRKYKQDDMIVNRRKLKLLVNKYGFYCSKDLADALNSIAMRMVEEAIGRVYNLPGRMERITVRPSDLPLMLQ